MNDAPISVAFVVDSLAFGGAEKHTLQLFNGLATCGFRSALVYLKSKENLLHEANPESGPVWCADFGKGWDFAGLIRLADWIRGNRPDVLVCVNTYPLFYGTLALWLSGHRCKIVEIFHSTELPKREYRQMRWVYRPFFNLVDRIIYVSATQRIYWENRGLTKDRGAVVHNGIDAELFQDSYAQGDKIALRKRLGFKHGDFIVGICAALRPEKMHEDLIEAVGRLKSAGISARCLVIGDGPRRASIETAIARFGLQGEAVITGFQPNVRPYVAVCDCMAIVSHQVETFSIAALEAMALSKPMVMSAIGGAAELVRDGENGYLYPAGNIEALTAALRKLSVQENRTKLGAQARAIVEKNFRLQVMLEKYKQLFLAISKE